MKNTFSNNEEKVKFSHSDNSNLFESIKKTKPTLEKLRLFFILLYLFTIFRFNEKSACETRRENSWILYILQISYMLWQGWGKNNDNWKKRIEEKLGTQIFRYAIKIRKLQMFFSFLATWQVAEKFRTTRKLTGGVRRKEKKEKHTGV